MCKVSRTEASSSQVRRANVLGRIRVIYSHTESEMRVYKIICRDVRERDPAVEEASEREGEKERETESKRG